MHFKRFINIMGQLCTGPDQIQLQLPPTQKYSVQQPVPKQTKQIEIAKSEHEPDESFAIKEQFTPAFPQKLFQRLKELGGFEYSQDENIPSGHWLNSGYRLKNGVVYVGQWKRGKIHGKGSYYLPDNSLLECITNQNQIVGHGRIIYPNGDYYDGEIANNQANGYGRYVEGKFTYEGQMKDNRLNGKGKEIGSNFIFEGQFEKGQRKKGKLTWITADCKYEYVGTFQDNAFSGKGILTTDQSRYEGEFKNGVKHGLGKFIWKNGNYYLGQFRSDKKQGEGNIFDAQGVLIDGGSWSNDKLD